MATNSSANAESVQGRFYLSTRKDRSSDAETIAKALISHGWVRTFDWGLHKTIDPHEYGSIAEAEIQGVREADALIVLLPGGFGTHVEIGVALALGKHVVLHAPDEDALTTPYACVFHYHPNVTRLISRRLDANDVLTALETI